MKVLSRKEVLEEKGAKKGTHRGYSAPLYLAAQKLRIGEGIKIPIAETGKGKLRPYDVFWHSRWCKTCGLFGRKFRRFRSPDKKSWIIERVADDAASLRTLSEETRRKIGEAVHRSALAKREKQV